VYPIIRKGQMRNFRQAESIASRIVYREKVGESTDGQEIEAAIAINREGTRNTWFVALVLIDAEVWARSPFGQAMKFVQVDKALRAWQRAIGFQFKIMMDEPGRYIWRSQHPEKAADALRRVWPEHLLQLAGSVEAQK